MAKLVECRACKKEVSRNAKKCPHCGDADPTNSTMETLVGCLGIFVLACIVLTLFTMCSGDTKEKLDSDLTNAENEYLKVSRRIIANGNLADWVLNRDTHGRIIVNLLANEMLEPPRKGDAKFIDMYGKKLETCLNVSASQARGDLVKTTAFIRDVSKTCWTLMDKNK